MSQPKENMTKPSIKVNQSKILSKGIPALKVPPHNLEAEQAILRIIVNMLTMRSLQDGFHFWWNFPT